MFAPRWSILRFGCVPGGMFARRAPRAQRGIHAFIHDVVKEIRHGVIITRSMALFWPSGATQATPPSRPHNQPAWSRNLAPLHAIV